MPFLLTRTRLLDALAGAPPLAAIIAPAGWGKSSLLETAATSDLRLIPVSLGNTEGHPSLLVEAIAQGLKRAYPGTAVGAVRAVAGLRTDEAPHRVLERTREALGVARLTFGFDEIERLPRGPVFEILRKLVRDRSDTTRFVFTSRQPLPGELGSGIESAIGVRDLALRESEIERFIEAEGGPSEKGVARALLAETGGWPALVSARLRASRAATVKFAEIAQGLSPIVDEAIAHIKSEARYVLQIAAIVGRFELSLIQAIASGDVPGSPEARRRLMRLEPAAVARALEELVRSNLVVPSDAPGATGTELQCLVGLRGVLRDRFLQQDRAGWLEAHRRAAELRLAALGSQALTPSAVGATPQVGADLVDLFAASGERERLLEVLSRHGSRLEFELAAADQNGRILEWIDALEAGPLPFWCDILAALVLARRGDSERAKERLERARDKLTAERKEASLWRWQARLAEAQALAARAKGDFNDARSWLLRGLDQLGQTKKRGLPNVVDESEANALELRMSVTLARLCREATGWDKTREAVTAALAMLAREATSAAALPAGAGGAAALERLLAQTSELRRVLIAGAFAAGDGAALEVETRREPPDGISQAARIVLALLRDASIERAVDRLRHMVIDAREPLACLLLVRLLEAGRERDRFLEDAAASGDPWVSLEAELRRPRDGSGGTSPAEGFSSAVHTESQAQGPGRALELARDAYRRVGARWEEARLWLVLGAAAARRVDDGDGEIEAVVRPVDGVIEASQTAGFVIPWSFAGRGEPDPERRVRTLLLAGLRNGQDKTKATCREELERLGIDTRIVAATAERSKGGPAQRRHVVAGGSPFMQISRTGSQGLSAADYQAIVSSKAASSFVVCVPDQLVLNFGRQLSLGQKRVMMPLLLHLLRNPDESYSMLELAREIWDSPELTPTVQTKVKVAVSRLRALLGKSRNYIITTRKTEGGESVVAYQTAPQLQFSVIETAPRE